MLARAEAYRTPPLDYFQELGRTVAARWEAAGHDEAAFADIATATLREMPGAGRVDPQQLLDVVLATPEFLNMGSSDAFGEPAIPVFLDRRFHIEVLFWFDGTHGIHDHSFSGAFQVLSGSSIHGEYDFDVRETFSPHFKLGKTALKHIEALRAGDTRRILPGKAFLHALFHLDHPSTTIVVRTHTSQAYLPSLIYVAPHVAIDGFYGNRSLALRRRALGAAAKIAPDRLADVTANATDGADAISLYLILATYMRLEGDATRRAALLDRLRPRHGALIDAFAPVFDSEIRVAEIFRARALARAPEHRYLYAMLLNCPTLATILDLTAARVPDLDPAATLARWFDEIARIDALGFSLDDARRAALARRLRREGIDDDAERALRAMPLLRPLFSD